jgi:hypothetical protein
MAALSRRRRRRDALYMDFFTAPDGEQARRRLRDAVAQLESRQEAAGFVPARRRVRTRCPRTILAGVPSSARARPDIAVDRR